MDENSVDDTLCPGKLKVEFEHSSGDYVALAPKTYCCLDTDSGAIKKGQKGIPRHKKIEMNQFLEALYDEKQFSSESQSLLVKVFFFMNIKNQN